MGIKYSDLNLSVNNTVKEVSFKDIKFNVLKYLPWDKKYDLIMITLQQSQENGIFNQLKLDMFFHLYMVYLYTDIEFTDEEKSDTIKIYDELKSSGLMDIVIGAIEEDEYNSLIDMMSEIVKDRTEMNKSVFGVLDKFINELPEKAQVAMNLIENFDKEKFQNVIDFATAANGNRPIE